MKKASQLILALLFTAAGSAQAYDWFGGRLSLGGGYGFVKPKLPYRFQDTFKEGHMWTAHMKYFVNNDVSLVASYADLHAKNRTSTSDIHFRPVVGSVRYNIFHHLPFTPYLTAGAGVGFNRKENPNGSVTRWNKPVFQGGLGLEFFINEHTSIGAEALYHNFIGDNHAKPYRLASAVGLVNLYFGEGPQTRRIREDAAREKQRADEALAQAASAQQQVTASQQMTASAQDAAAAANAAKAEADRRTQEMEAQLGQAQAEIEEIKQMVARKDISPVTFASGQASLLESSNATLNKVAETAKKYPSLKLRVEGHTDSVGEDTYNQTLSQERADAVQEYLVNTGGVPSEQIVAAGFGETRPVASNDTADGRAQNRRVEFIFFIK